LLWLDGLRLYLADCLVLLFLYFNLVSFSINNVYFQLLAINLLCFLVLFDLGFLNLYVLGFIGGLRQRIRCLVERELLDAVFEQVALIFCLS